MTTAHSLHNLVAPAGTSLPVTGFAVTYDRQFNLGEGALLAPAITIWTQPRQAHIDPADLHAARERVRRMARENVRAQWQRQQGRHEVLFLGLMPLVGGVDDPIQVQAVSVTLAYSVPLGEGNRITPAYTDWADLRAVAHTPSDLHMALARMWQALWANVTDDIHRAQGHGDPATAVTAAEVCP